MPGVVHPRRASQPIFPDNLGVQVERRARLAPRFIGDVGPHGAEALSIADGADRITNTGCLQRQPNLAEPETKQAVRLLNAAPPIGSLGQRLYDVTKAKIVEQQIQFGCWLEPASGRRSLRALISVGRHVSIVAR